MSVAETDSRLRFMPLEDATAPKSGEVFCYRDHWWVVHPSRGLVLWNFGKHDAPQCNVNKAITERIRDKMYPWAEVQQMPVAFVRER